MKKKIPLTSDVLGLTLADPVKLGGNILLDSGITLNEDYLARLLKRNIPFITIDVPADPSEIQPAAVEKKRVVCDSLETSARYIFGFSAENDDFDDLLSIVSRIPDFRDSEGTSVLIQTLNLNVGKHDHNRLKIEVIRALQRMPFEPAISHALLILLSLTVSMETKYHAFDAISKFKDPDIIYPLLAGICKYPEELREKLTETVSSFSQKDLVDNLRIIFDECEKGICAEVFCLCKNILDQDIMLSLARIYDLQF